MTRDDIVRVRIEDIKIELQGRQAEVKAALEAIQAEVTGHNKTIADIGDELLEGIDLAPFQAIVDDFLGIFSFRYAKAEKPLVTTRLAANDQTSQPFTIEIVSPLGLGYSNSLSKTETIKYPSPAKAAVKSLLGLAAEAAKHQTELNDIRRKLSDLPNEAERFRAQLSRMALQQAGTFGASVLDVIDNSPKVLGTNKSA